MSRMKHRECAKCGAFKPVTAFPMDRPGHYRPKCKECFNAERRIVRRKVQNEEAVLPKKAPFSKTYVITWAQNATPVHKPFLESLERFCEHNDAVLLVLPGRYRNPTSHWSKPAQNDEWWAKELAPYLFAGRRNLGDHLTIYGDIPIQPTAVRPLTGFEVFSGKSSAIFGHPKIQLKTIPTAKRRYPRILSTTGAVTVRNYTDSKAGKKGEAHHVFGAAVVEQGSDLFHIRQINATNDGTFIDLDTLYTPEGAEPAPPAKFVVLGDIHEDLTDEAVMRATREVLDTLTPEETYIHDLLHFGRRGHHNIQDFKHRFDLREDGERDLVEPEVMASVRFLDQMPDYTTPVVVRSNHDEMFDRWLREAEPKHDPVNALFFHETWTRVLRRRVRDGFWTPAFQVVYDELSEEQRAVFLERDEPRKVGDIFLNFHGDTGTNGGKGSPLSYAKLGVKVVIGHVHSPEILDGCYVVGVTGALDQGYNRLPSGWMHAHCAGYANGKRSLIFIIEGEWRG